MANSKMPMISHSSIRQVTRTLSLFHLWTERLSQMMEVCLSILSFFRLLIPCIPASHGRPQRNKRSCLQDILAAERLDEWGELDKKHRQPKRRLKCQMRNTKRVKVMGGLSDLDPEDNEYQTDLADSTSEANDTSDDNISNGEVSASYQ